MAPKKIPTRREESGRAAQYRRKAEEFLRAALDSLGAHRWNAAALAAVHAGIAGGDAALVFAKGVRSTSQRHEDVVDLLSTAIPEATPVLPHLRRLLAKKHLVEYESRLFSEAEAREAVRHAERFLAWIRARVGDSGPTDD
jgi:uncharacterized protein (UPF0332 family)